VLLVLWVLLLLLLLLLLELELELVVHWLLLRLRPSLTHSWGPLPPTRHGWMRGVLRRGRRNVWLTDLVRRVRLLPLVTHL